MYLLKRQRSAFSLVTAIVVMVLMATVGAFVLNISSKTVQATTVQYQQEQAILYAKSYTEFAILAVTGNDRTIDCVEDISAYIKTDPTSSISVSNGNGYRVRGHIAYIVDGSVVDTSKCSATRVLNNTVSSSAMPLSILVDIYVDYKTPDNPTGPWMTVHRRTVQKI